MHSARRSTTSHGVKGLLDDGIDLERHFVGGSVSSGIALHAPLDVLQQTRDESEDDATQEVHVAGPGVFRVVGLASMAESNISLSVRLALLMASSEAQAAMASTYSSLSASGLDHRPGS